VCVLLHERKIDPISVNEFKARHKPRQVFNYQEPEPTQEDITQAN